MQNKTNDKKEVQFFEWLKEKCKFFYGQREFPLYFRETNDHMLAITGPFYANHVCMLSWGPHCGCCRSWLIRSHKRSFPSLQQIWWRYGLWGYKTHHYFHKQISIFHENIKTSLKINIIIIHRFVLHHCDYFFMTITSLVIILYD
jgi:hypothetical protein